MTKALLVSDTAVPRYLVAGNVLGTPTPAVTVDGSLSAGSRRLLGSADALTEMVRLDFSSLDTVRELNVMVELGQAAHAFAARVVVNAGDDVEAALALNSGVGAVHALPGDPLSLTSDVAITTLHVIGVPAVGATATSVKGRIFVEGRSYA